LTYSQYAIQFAWPTHNVQYNLPDRTKNNLLGPLTIRNAICLAHSQYAIQCAWLADKTILLDPLTMYNTIWLARAQNNLLAHSQYSMQFAGPLAIHNTICLDHSQYAIQFAWPTHKTISWPTRKHNTQYNLLGPLTMYNTICLACTKNNHSQ